MADILTLFKRHFGHTPVHVTRAPVRLELLGDYAESSEGLALTVAVNRYVSIAVAPRRDGRVELHSTSGTERFWVSELQHSEAQWANRIKAVLDQLRKRGASFSGFSAAIHGDVSLATSPGAAALEAATALALRRLHPFALAEVGLAPPPKTNAKNELPPPGSAEKMRYARLCQAAESACIGAPSGLLDAITSLYGRAWNAINIDFRFLSVELLPLIGEALVLCEAGPSAADAPADPSEILRDCESAARKLGAKTLRSVELKFLEANRAKLTPDEYSCACHIVGEIARVAAAERALRNDDHSQLGHYLNLSRESAREHLAQRSAETDLLFDLARAQPGCLGGRRAGSGHGNATINLVAYHQAGTFMQSIAEQFEEHTGAKLQVTLCQIVDGAG